MANINGYNYGQGQGNFNTPRPPIHTPALGFNQIAGNTPKGNASPPQGANSGNFWWADPDVMANGGEGGDGAPNHRAFLQRQPFRLMDRFQNIENEGVYGKDGVDQITGRASANSALRRRRLGGALRRGRLGRQLGPRSGAINNLLANKVWAPELEKLTESEMKLLRENLLSKTSIGTKGLASMMEFVNSRYQSHQNRQAQIESSDSGGGFLDFMGPLADIASLIPGPQQPAVAGAAAVT